MRNIIFILMLCMSVPFLNAQNPDSTLEGFVFRSQTNAPLEGVNVIILGTNLGDATNADGYYKIEQIIPGEYELEFKLIGYKTQRMRLKIASDKITKRDVTLDPKVLKGKEVSVEGERVDDIRLKVSPPTFKLHPQDVVGLPGAIEDVMRSIQTLPGVLATSDYSNQFIVRGGGPDQNLILLDDVEIYNPYRSSGMPSLINPAIIQSINLYTGGFPAIFGDRLSSVLTMHTRDGTNQKWLAGQIGLDFIKADWVLEGKLPTLNGSWLVSGRRTHNGLFAEDFSKRLTLNSVAFPNFEDWHAKLVLRPNEKTRWQVHGVFGKNDQDWLIKGELGEQDSDRDQLDGEDNIENLAIGASWNYLPTSDVQVKAFVNWYKNSGHSGLQGDFIPRNDRFSPDQPFPPPPPFGVTDTTFFNYHQLFNFKKFSAGGWMVQQTEKHVPEIGLGLDFFDNSIGAELEIDEFGRTIMNTLSKAPNWFGALADSANVNSRYQRFYIYVQNKMAFMNGRLHIQPGIRYDLYGVTDSQYLSPRLKLTYRLDQDTEINAAWGLYRQSPGFEKLLDGGEVFDVLKFGELNGLVAEKAMHSVLGVTRSFHDRFFLTLETYYKKFDDLVSQLTRLLPLPKGVYQADAPGRANSYKIVDVPTFSKIPVADNNLTGRAYGLDVLLEKRLDGPSDKWSGWVSYSLAHSTREQNIDGQRLSYPFDFDRRHTVNMVFNYRLTSKLNFGFTWRFGTGFPYTPVATVEPLVGIFRIDSTTVRSVIFEDPDTGYARFIPDFGGPENINSVRYPDYHRLDARLTYAIEFLKTSWKFHLDFINLYNRKNVLFYRNIIKIEVQGENLPPSLQFPKPALFREPVYMYPFIPSFGVSVAF